MTPLPLRAQIVRALVLLVATPALLAFAFYDASWLPPYTYEKWGDPAIPTGATVYWSLMPVGTAGSEYCSSACPGTSTLTLPNFYDWTTHSFSPVQLTDPAIFGYIRAAFRAWGAAAGVNFVYVPNDSGVAINDPAAEPPATGQIRIGVFDMGFNGPALGYAPPPNGFYPNSLDFATGAGDVIFNSNSIYAFQNPAGAEGSPLESYPEGGGSFLNDFQGLVLHEIGHALGLDHTDVASAVMCGWPHPCTYDDPQTYVINRQPEPDDVAGMQTLYGPPADGDGDGVPNAIDNCMSVANNDAGTVPNSNSVPKTQLDADGDGYGNFCDADINQSGSTTVADYTRLRNVLNRPYNYNADSAAADMNGSGSVTTADYTLLRNRLNTPPGPSGFAP